MTTWVKRLTVLKKTFSSSSTASILSRFLDLISVKTEIPIRSSMMLQMVKEFSQISKWLLDNDSEAKPRNHNFIWRKTCFSNVDNSFASQLPTGLKPSHTVQSLLKEKHFFIEPCKLTRVISIASAILFLLTGFTVSGKH